ncbi:hypothetical protein [Cryobacterium serini]|uniref:MmyB-like transcription regulator ligand binding domain-containing protein n=1 Tax=Cryobacterium serini TaxID=1259201 RepID=A0A4R9BTK2_9MICO|nr:hypothetical protein [Cryobacterium serini]TFD90056.1 hypothetical protein E3T51_04990 [Cryobacterium serini]
MSSYSANAWRLWSRPSGRTPPTHSNLHDTELKALVAELREQSPLFGEWWDEHIVERRRASLKHLRTPDGETIARRYEVLRLPDEGIRVTIWLPET